MRLNKVQKGWPFVDSLVLSLAAAEASSSSGWLQLKPLNLAYCQPLPYSYSLPRSSRVPGSVHTARNNR